MKKISSVARFLMLSIIALFLTIRCGAQVISGGEPDNPLSSVSPYVYLPKVTKTLIKYDSLAFGFVRGLRIVPNPLTYSCTEPTRSIRKATLFVTLKMGENDYTFDTTSFIMTLGVRVKGYNSSGVLVPGADYPCTLTIQSKTAPLNKIIPEQVFMHDFTAEYPGIDSLAVSIDSWSDNLGAPSPLSKAAKLEVRYTEEWNLSPFNNYTLPPLPYINAQATTEGDSTDAPRVEITWTPGRSDCDDSVGNYQVQLMRLYNVDPSRTTDERSVKARIDWSQAMTLETGSGKRSITLTLAEGSGYYAFRVRAIGNLYPGGAGDERNWGEWTNAPAQGTLIDLPTDLSGGGVFFFRQFDENLNWIYHRQFSESEDGTKIAEEMTYATGLMQGKQHQRYLASSDAYVTTQTVYDYSGRPAMTSLPSPVYDKAGFGYIATALTYYDMLTIPKLYTADNFDKDVNFRSPDPVNLGITDYYSDKNHDKTIPSAGGYAFTRTLYLEDGLDRPREVGGPGTVHRIGSTIGGGKNRTARTYYGTPTDYELIRLFGDEAPAASTVQKVFSVDPNNMVHVAYVDNAGLTIATCMARGIDSTILDKLDEPVVLDTIASDVISDNVPFGERGLVASKTIVVPQPTTLYLHYEITPKTIQNACASFCVRCDYVVTLKVHHVDDPTKSWKYRMTFSGGDCLSPFPPTFDTTVALPDPGSYIVERIIETGNTDPLTVTTESPSGRTYLDEHLTTVRASVAGSVNASLSHVNEHLGRNDLTGLYRYLEDTLHLAEDSAGYYHVNVPIGCGLIDIPKRTCEANACRFGHPSFEALLHDMWDKGRTGVTLNDFFFTDSLPTYQYVPTDSLAGTFDRMIDRMIDSAGYDCTYLFNVWRVLMEAYPMLATTDGSGNPSKLNRSFDLLDMFMRMAGRKLRGFSNCKSGDCGGGKKGYISHPYWYFHYQAGTDTVCEHYSRYAASGSGWTKDSTAQWALLADCVNASGSSIPDSLKKYQPAGWGNDTSETAITTIRSRIQDTCKSKCEQKLLGFRLAVIDAYHKAGKVVQGDQTLPDGSDIPAGYGPGGIGYDIPLTQVECAAWALVDKCQEGCALSIVRDGGGHIKGLGTGAERVAMTKSMYCAFEAHVPDGSGNCPTGFSLVSATGRNRNRMLVNYLNRELKKLRDEAGVMGFDDPTCTYEWNRVSELLGSFGLSCIFGPPITPTTSVTWDRASSGCPPNLLQYLFIQAVDIHGEFSLGTGADSCKLYYTRYCSRFNLLPPSPLSVMPDTLLPEDTYTMVVCTNVCAQSCSTQICFRWLDPTVRDTTLLLRDLTCEETTGAYLREYIDKQVRELIQGHLDRLQRDYRTTCTAPSSIQDLFRVGYKLQEYHFTLFYHDRAGNLVKTVPPAGVTLSARSRSQHPAHQLASGYEFNSLHQQVHKRSPDAGDAWTYYDDKGEVRFSKNAKQAVDSNYAYVKYDRLGRVIETGKVTGNPATLSSANVNNASGFPTTASGTEKVMTVYTSSSGSTLNGRPQRFLQNRISHIFTDDSVHTHYSYDAHGNVAWIEQGLPGLGKTTVAYDYDLIGLRPLMIRYNEGFADQFFHKYEYDADGRMVVVKTSRDQVIWDRDLANRYFDHGPLKRAMYGEDSVQGMDYVYTIQGWLKAINHPALGDKPAFDPGSDGTGNSYAADAFGMILNYYWRDFQHRSGGADSPYDSISSDGPSWYYQKTGRDLYDGNIANWTTNMQTVTPGPGVPTMAYPGISANQYRYDELGRLIQEDFFHANSIPAHGLSGSVVDDYRSWFRYDPDGSIQRVLRNGNLGNVDMDSLEYHYLPGTHQLDWVHDVVPAAAYSSDIDNQAPGRYQYDAIGQMIADNDPAEPALLNWSLYNKVKLVSRPSGTTTRTIVYTYDGRGNKVKKEVTTLNSFQVPPSQSTATTWYVYDATGKVLAIYERSCSDNSLPPPPPGLNQPDGAAPLIDGIPELPQCLPRVASWLIYGNASQDRIATVDPSGVYRGLLTPAMVYSRILREKGYELKDHLGSVRAIASDMKIADPSGPGQAPYKADIQRLSNHYAFGMEQPQRSYNGPLVPRFGFAGTEHVDELSNAKNTYSDFGARLYDVRLARWMSADRLREKYPSVSPYAYGLNSPIVTGDAGGDSVILYTSNRRVLAALDLLYATPLGKELLDKFISSTDRHIYISDAASVDGYLAVTLYGIWGAGRMAGLVVDGNFDFSAWRWTRKDDPTKAQDQREIYMASDLQGVSLMCGGDGVHSVIFVNPELFNKEEGVSGDNLETLYHEIFSHIDNRRGSNSYQDHHEYYYGGNGEIPIHPNAGTPYDLIWDQINAIDRKYFESVRRYYLEYYGPFPEGVKFDPAAGVSVSGVNDAAQ